MSSEVHRHGLQYCEVINQAETWSKVPSPFLPRQHTGCDPRWRGTALRLFYLHPERRRKMNLPRPLPEMEKTRAEEALFLLILPPQGRYLCLCLIYHFTILKTVTMHLTGHLKRFRNSTACAGSTRQRWRWRSACSRPSWSSPLSFIILYWLCTEIIRDDCMIRRLYCHTIR